MADIDDLELDDEDFAAVRAQLRAAWTRRGGSVDDMPDAITFAESDLPDSCFAYVPDEAKGADGAKSKRKLRLCNMDGELDAGIIGAAAAALGPGFRGQTVDLPSDAVGPAKRKVRAAWRKVNPDKDADDMPEGIKASEANAFTFAEQQHSGILVALWLDEDTAEELALSGGEPADNLHVTVCYCGDADDMSEIERARVLVAVENEARYQPMITGRVGGYGRFLASDTSDGQDVFYAAVDIPDLAGFRERIDMALMGAGCEPSRAHGYTPHITLAYLDPGAKNPVDTLPALDLRFSAVTVVIGGKRYDMPLSSLVSMYAIREDEAMVPHGPGRAIPCTKFHVYQPVDLAEPPEWSPFLPVPGRYDHPIYGELDFSPDVYNRIIANFKSGIYQDKLPVNAEHDPHAAGAVGWIVDMRLAETGAIEAKVEWNERGTALIEDDRYKYVSAEVMPVWHDPVEPDKEYRDVAVGLALTTHPYFKERVLPPLAASEAVLTRHAGEPGKEVSMGNNTAQDQQQTPPADQQRQNEGGPVTQTTPLTLAQPGAKLTEEVIAEFKAVKADLAKTQAEVAKYREENTALKEERALDEATKEVRGRSDENGTPWVGDAEQNIKLLHDMIKAFGKGSPQVKNFVEQSRAHAEQMKQSDLYREFGTSRGGDASGAQGRIDAAVEAYLTAHPDASRAQAVTRVLSERPELYDEYQRDRR